MSRIYIRLFILSGILALSFACQTRHEVAVAPVEVKPIHITIDVNVRIDKELDDFFGDIDEVEDELEKAASK
jgi:hypothetical protein